MVVDEKELRVGRRARFGENVDERPARVRKVNRPRGELGDGIDEPHLRVEAARVRLADRVREVEKDAPRELVGLVAPLGAVDAFDELVEVDAERRRANEDVPLAEDLDGAVLGIVLAVTEIPRDVALGLEERRLHRSRYSNGLQRHHASPSRREPPPK